MCPDGAANGFPEGAGVTYLYDALGRVATIQDPVAGTWQLDYDAIGRLVHRVDPGGFARSLSYTAEGFVERVRLEGPGGVVDEFVYAGHDALGNPGTITSAEGTTTLSYDAASRVEQVDYPGGESEVFDYDLRGNRKSHTTRSGDTWIYDYDAADQLLAINDPAAGLVASFAHDGAGRRTAQTFEGVATQFSYDGAGRLVGVSRPGYQATLGHDPEGLRYRRAETGQPAALFFGEWVERRGGETVRLTHGPGVDNVVAEVTLAGDVRTLLRNGTANVTHVAVAGTLEPAPRRYEAFGGVRSGSSIVERGFAGRPPEGATGLINLRARHYDPVTGTFLQVDPLGIEAVQIYAYARQNPYRFWDPLGLEAGEPDLIFGVDSSIHASAFGPGSSGGSTIGPQEPAANLFGALDLYSTSPISDILFPNRGPLHYLASGYEDYLVRGLSGQWEPGEEFLAVVPSGPVIRRGARALGGLGDDAIRLLPEVSRSGRLTQARLDHIVERHFFGSSAPHAGKFAEGASQRQHTGGSAMTRYVTGTVCLIAILLVALAAVVGADGRQSEGRAFEDAGRLGGGAEVKIEARLSTGKTASEAFPGALWWGDEQGSAKSNLSFLKIKVGGKSSWIRLSAYADLADVREVALKIESDGFRVEIEGGEQSTHYTANVYFDREGYLLRRRVEGASFPSEVWEETNYSFIRRKGM